MTYSFISELDKTASYKLKIQSNKETVWIRGEERTNSLRWNNDIHRRR